MIKASIVLVAFVWSMISFAARDERGRVFFTPRPQNQSFSSPTSDANSESCKSGKAANLAIASLFGSCEAPKTSKGPAVGGGNDLCGNELPQSGEIKSTFQSGCGSGGMPEYSQEGERMKLEGNVVKFPSKKTDCSGLASGILCRAGNNIKPGDSSCKAHTTEEMINWGKGGDCFERVTDGKLKPGDMIVTRSDGGTGHVVTVADDKGGGGPDDFTVAEASSKKTGIVKRSPAAAGSATARAFKNALAGGDGGGQWAVLRHTGEKNKACKADQKRNFEGEQCVQSCPNISPDVNI